MSDSLVFFAANNCETKESCACVCVSRCMCDTRTIIIFGLLICDKHSDAVRAAREPFDVCRMCAVAARRNYVYGPRRDGAARGGQTQTRYVLYVLCVHVIMCSI